MATVPSLQGDTGSGKSSTLNALLGEVCILPTNGMRACTAAIIELMAHDAQPLPPPGVDAQPVSLGVGDAGGSRPAAPYIGVVEFLSR